ncbi:DUF2214 family protein [Marinoscillum furvescens]|uniref:Putative membrane protein n=1 Tax=Marinoscillum furvescens DSM 4134 TaxID=1122208 RepID=A0A3D9L3Z3_MARFU|nr:DUF2214 family protein [Marinoscillum furvescens]RED98013.1 putative membrane protein [Marinoscillum furvescens DSM 4134]
MSLFILIKYIHYASIFLVVSTLVTELLMIKPIMSREELRKLARIDALYGLGAVLTLIAGLTLWFFVGKPAAFYTGNWTFILKVVLFTLVGVLSIWPTMYFIRERKGEQSDFVTVPAKIRQLIRAEVILVWLIPLLAVLMANGFDLFR